MLQLLHVSCFVWWLGGVNAECMAWANIKPQSWAQHGHYYHQVKVMLWMKWTKIHGRNISFYTCNVGLIMANDAETLLQIVSFFFFFLNATCKTFNLIKNKKVRAPPLSCLSAHLSFWLLQAEEGAFRSPWLAFHTRAWRPWLDAGARLGARDNIPV